MPTVATDLQRKYRYEVSFTVYDDTTVSGTTYSGVAVDEFTPPDKRFDAVTRQNQSLGQISLAGPASYGEMTMRLALRITGDASNDSAQLIDALQKMNLKDADTCDVTLSMVSDVDGVRQVTYRHGFINCRLTGLKLDPLNRRGDDDMLHIELSLIPSRVQILDGTQM